VRASGIDPFVVADGLDTRFGFDGFWQLNPNDVANAALPGWFDTWAQAAKLSTDRALGSAPALWAAGVSPGEDDTYSGKATWQMWNIPRRNGDRYNEAWQAAAATNPDWVVISSWNDFHEATYIQPSRNLGSRALDQTRAWANWFSHH
jgi:hypothetical protein